MYVHMYISLQVEQTLPLDKERQTYVASLISPHTGVSSLPCVVTGINYSCIIYDYHVYYVCIIIKYMYVV